MADESVEEWADAHGYGNEPTQPTCERCGVAVATRSIACKCKAAKHNVCTDCTWSDDDVIEVLAHDG
jgi:hypothetical protein